MAENLRYGRPDATAEKLDRAVRLAALDLATEARLVERIVPWLRARTALVMTHRRAFAEAADVVLRMEKGRIHPLKGWPG